jgi:hypothetical protein
LRCGFAREPTRGRLAGREAYPTDIGGIIGFLTFLAKLGQFLGVTYARDEREFRGRGGEQPVFATSDFHMLTIDDSRAEFIHAFKTYAQEGNLMRDLLLSQDSVPAGSSLSDAVAAQQRRLNEARDRYQQARSTYVQAILAMLNVPHGDSNGSQPMIDIRQPVTGPH